MSYPVFNGVPAGDVLPIPFTTYAGATGASVTMTGLAVTDIEVYKDASMTQRSSDAGYTLMDTDGIDIDGVTGFHGFSIDTGDNTDAGFYAVGAWYTVLVSAITVDSQTVSFIAAMFRLVAAESVAGKPKVDVDTFGGTAGTFSGGRAEVNVSHAAGTAWNSGAIGAATLATDTITAAKVAADAVTEIQSGLSTLNAAGIRTAVGLASANLDTQLADIEGKVDDLEGGIILGTAATGTLTSTAFTSSLSGYANDALIGRVLIFLSGTLVGQANAISDYASSGGLLTFADPFTTAPSNADSFKIV